MRLSVNQVMHQSSEPCDPLNPLKPKAPTKRSYHFIWLPASAPRIAKLDHPTGAIYWLSSIHKKDPPSNQRFQSDKNTLRISSAKQNLHSNAWRAYNFSLS